MTRSCPSENRSYKEYSVQGIRTKPYKPQKDSILRHFRSIALRFQSPFAEKISIRTM